MANLVNTPEANNGKPAKKSLTDTVKLEADAVSLLNTHARNAGISKCEYASAAIRYFAENGLDPTKTTTLAEGVKTREKLLDVSYDVRKLTGEVGTRIIAILRNFEKENYKYQQAQQGGLFAYLGQIEDNILSYQQMVESQVLAPMLERVIRNGVDTHIARVLTNAVLLKTKDQPLSNEEVNRSTANYDGQRDKQLVVEAQKIADKSPVARPRLTARPALTPVPAPPKPAAQPVPAATPVTPPAPPKP
ncbi:hypothetical protein [Hymenobacter psoromatis]|uniref:hypothetical protein n=1 Tax=Hymenobacter psoromatis TaxID=1484116 RepID=UPI001CBEEB47|nr:hypothetical protein [Hymenobacter psoromatis]